MTEPSDEALMRAADMLRGMQRSHEVEVAVATLLQEVSDVAKVVVQADLHTPAALQHHLAPFILPEPVDPLEDALREALQPNLLPAATSYPAALRKALAKRNLKIVEASHDG